MSDVLWRRLRYMLTPQFDLYQYIAPKLRDLDVIEVGFGTGFGTVQLAGRAKNVYALEVDPDAWVFAEKSLPLVNVSWHCANITKFALDRQFDAAVMVEVLEHIADWRTALHNVNNLLKPNGLLYITARNRNADLRRNDLHEREWQAQEFVGALSEFFLDVKLFDYTLTQELDRETRATPLVAVARKAGGNEHFRIDLSTGRLEGSLAQAYALDAW